MRLRKRTLSEFIRERMLTGKVKRVKVQGLELEAVEHRGFMFIRIPAPEHELDFHTQLQLSEPTLNCPSGVGGGTLQLSIEGEADD